MAFYQCVKVGGGGTGDVADVEVNGTSVVDPTTKIAEITSYEEVTESEYEAIPVAERESNGIAYFIKDLNNESVQGYPPLIYSDEEREIGVWRDGMPLYQKTVHVGALVQDSSWHGVSHGVANLDKCINIEAICIATNGTEFYPINLYRPTTNTGVMVYATASDVYYMNNYYSEMEDAYFTIRYTKTTDTAGSGTWNGQGGLAHHYSTNETVTGTWIDGKPLYQKTFVQQLSGTTGTIDISALNVSEAFIAGGFYDIGVTNLELNEWVTQNDNTYAHVNKGLSPQVIDMKCTWANAKATIILQYTKTTD